MIPQWLELGGIPLYHLDNYCHLLNELADNDLTQDYDQLRTAIELAGQPFLKRNSSDEMNTLAIASKSFTTIAYLLNLPSTSVQKTICTSIISFFKHKHSNTACHPEYQKVSADFCKRAIQNSDVLKTILETLPNLCEVDDITSRLQVVRTLLGSADSTFGETCSVLKPTSVLIRNAYLSLRNPVLDIRVRQKNIEIIAYLGDILFECLTTDDQKPSTSTSVEEISITEDIVTSLFDIFVELLKVSSSTKLRKRRNDVLSLLNILVESNSTYYIQTGIVQTLLQLSLQPEKSNQSIGFRIRVSNSSEDFEMKKLMWLFVNKISTVPSALRTISEHSILSNFFQFIQEPTERKQSPEFPWTVAQRYELEHLALDSLCALTPVLLEDFVECHGVTRLTIYLQACLQSDSQDRVQLKRLKSILKVIRQIVVLDCEPINSEFVDQGLIQLILNELQVRKCVELGLDTEVKQDLFFILAVLCEYSIERKDILGDSGIMLFIEYLNICVNGLHASSKSNGAVPSREQILVVYVVDCIWSCVCGALTVEKMFIEHSGVFLLLDALERATTPIYPIILGTLCELCDNKTALSHLVQWKSSINGRTNALQLFMEIWRCVEVKSSHTRSVIDDIFKTPMAKIFTLCQKLEGQKFDKELSKRDQITLAGVKRYLDFKIHDAWCEVDRQLRVVDDLKPIPCDEEMLRRTFEEKCNKEDNLKEDVDKLDQEQEKEVKDDECLAYERTNTAYYSIEAKHRRWRKKLQLTSDHQELIRESSKRTNLLEASRALQEIPTDSSSSAVNHKLIFPLKNNTTSHAKILTIDS